MPNIQLYTPRDENLSAGIVCFDVKGMKPEQVVKRLLDQRIVASTSPYRVSYARVACSVVNTPQEIDAVLRAIRQVGLSARASPAFAQHRRGWKTRGYNVAVREGIQIGGAWMCSSADRAAASRSDRTCD